MIWENGSWTQIKAGSSRKFNRTPKLVSSKGPLPPIFTGPGSAELEGSLGDLANHFYYLSNYST